MVGIHPQVLILAALSTHWSAVPTSCAHCILWRLWQLDNPGPVIPLTLKVRKLRQVKIGSHFYPKPLLFLVMDLGSCYTLKITRGKSKPA